LTAGYFVVLAADYSGRTTVSWGAARSKKANLWLNTGHVHIVLDNGFAAHRSRGRIVSWGGNRKIDDTRRSFCCPR